MEKRKVKLRIYISGPISGHDEEACRKRFKEVQQKLEAKGWEVFNPMENGLPFNAETHRHMHRDLAELTREDKPYDAIYMMRRWTHSKGCKVEFDVATAMGLRVGFEEVDAMLKFE